MILDLEDVQSLLSFWDLIFKIHPSKACGLTNLQRGMRGIPVKKRSKSSWLLWAMAFELPDLAFGVSLSLCWWNRSCAVPYICKQCLCGANVFLQTNFRSFSLLCWSLHWNTVSSFSNNSHFPGCPHVLFCYEGQRSALSCMWSVLRLSLWLCPKMFI